METTTRMAVGASMGAVSRRLGITPRALRYYEHRGLIATTRDRWNCRRYDATAQRQAEIVVRLRRCGLGIEDIAQALAGCGVGEGTGPEALPLLQRRLSELDAERNAVLEEIDRVDAAPSGRNAVCPALRSSDTRGRGWALAEQ